MVDKKVKIIATTGPAIDNAESILELAREGVDVFRINLSHATDEEIQNRVKWVRAAEKALKRPLTVMGDLAGPKIRIGDVVEGLEIEKGQKMRIYKDAAMGDAEGFCLNHPEIVDAIKVGAIVYVDDGNLKLEVIKKEKESVLVEVLVGGTLKPRKGFSVEGLSLDSQGLSEKDKKDIKRMLALGTDALAVSFVQDAHDILDVREQLPRRSNIFLVAKIETAKGIENAESILEVADGLMVARGDMGLAIPIAEVPHIQKKLINLSLEKAKPVITATQMLESMIHAPIPTRAEVTDVANAILDGTDAVMLSAETASGKFPAETVKMMVKIIRETLSHVSPRIYMEGEGIRNAVSAEVADIADRVKTKLIIAFTQTGSTARRISRNRHQETIIALSPEQSTLRHLNFSWGVHPMLITTTLDFDNMRQQAKETARHNEIVEIKKGDPIVITAGMPFGETGSTNMILVERV
jgi:pyruvate kinase